MAAGGTGVKRLERDPRDAYATPPWQTKLLLQHVEPHGIIFEPCAGTGAMADVLRDAAGPYDRIITADLHEGANSVLWPGWDATLRGEWDAVEAAHHGVDWVITNPPFKHAFEILKQAYYRARFGVAFILRTTFSEPTKDRGPWLAENPPDLRIVMPRCRYRQDTRSSDNVTTEWFVWYRANAERGTVVVPREDIPGFPLRAAKG